MLCLNSHLGACSCSAHRSQSRNQLPKNWSYMWPLDTLWC